MPKQEILYPHEVTQLISLEAKETVDPTNLDLELTWSKARDTDEGEHVLDLRGKGPSAETALDAWRELRFEVEARLRASELARILPAGSDFRESTLLMLSVRCPTTKIRMPVVMDADPQTAGLWRGDIHLRRHDVKSRVEIQPFLARKTKIPDDVELPGAFARFAGATIGAGEPLVIQIDQAAASVACPFSIRWIDFRHASAGSWLNTHHASLFHVRFAGAQRPEVLLNSEHGKLRAILDANPGTGIQGALQKLLNLGIAEAVWMQLFNAAVAGISRDSDTDVVDEPEGWRAEVLAPFLTTMFPDQDHQERVRAIADAREDADAMAVLVSQATTVAQKLVDAQALFAAAAREAAQSQAAQEER
jgi:hypothetical protein